MAQKCHVLDWVPGKATVLIYPILLSDTLVGYFDRIIDPVYQDDSLDLIHT